VILIVFEVIRASSKLRFEVAFYRKLMDQICSDYFENSSERLLKLDEDDIIDRSNLTIFREFWKLLCNERIGRLAKYRKMSAIDRLFD
jgi:hypothetical protein